MAATPARLGIVKIGYTNDIKDRQKSLNIEKYAGYTGWEIHAHRHVNEKGVIEHAAHGALKKHAFAASYFKEGKTQTASELFKYPLKDAISLLDTIVSNNTSQKSQLPSENRASAADKKKKGEQTTPSSHNYDVKSSTQSANQKSPKEGLRKVRSELRKKPQPATATSVETNIKDIPPLIPRPVEIKKNVVAPQSSPPKSTNHNVFSTQSIEVVNAEEPTCPLIELFKLLLCVLPAYAILYFMFAGGLNWLELFSIPRYVSLPLCYIAVVLLAFAITFISGNPKNKVVYFIFATLALPLSFVILPLAIVFFLVKSPFR